MKTVWPSRNGPWKAGKTTDPLPVTRWEVSPLGRPTARWSQAVRPHRRRTRKTRGLRILVHPRNAKAYLCPPTEEPTLLTRTAGPCFKHHQEVRFQSEVFAIGSSQGLSTFIIGISIGVYQNCSSLERPVPGPFSCPSRNGRFRFRLPPCGGFSHRFLIGFRCSTNRSDFYTDGVAVVA
jgi:hypothetical protein